MKTVDANLKQERLMHGITKKTYRSLVEQLARAQSALAQEKAHEDELS